MALKQEIKKLITEETLPVLLWLLCASYLCSHLASFFWAFDLFSHFLIQYCVAGLIFGFSFAVLKQHKSATVAFLVAGLSLFETRLNLQQPLNIFPVANASVQSVRLVQYNHLVLKQNFDDVKAWLSENADRFDVVVLQEATIKTVELADSIKNLYPHQIHKLHDPDSFGTIILSRHPIAEHSVIDIPGPVIDNYAIRAMVNIPNIDEPLALYALHAIPPTGYRLFQQRNEEILTVGDLISKDDRRYKVMIGDWNVTPYSPFFTKLLKTSGLNYQAEGLLQNPSWPCVPIYYALKIPIDHLLYSDSMQFIDKTTVSSFGSDHNAVVTTLGFLKRT